jgi:hypothetical protein
VSRKDGDTDDERDICEQGDAGHHPTAKSPRSCIYMYTHYMSLPPKKKSLKSSMHQTQSAGRLAAPPSSYQSPPRAAFSARATQHQATRAGRARERGRRANRARVSPRPPPCRSRTPTQSQCAVGDGGGHVYDTWRRRSR